MIILSGFFPAALAIMQYCENNKKEAEANKKEHELQSKIDNLNESNSNLISRISQLQSDNLNLSHQLTETSLHLNKSIIGENNLEFNIIPCSQTEYHFTIKNNDDLPALKAKILIENYNEIINCDILEKTDNKIIFDDACYTKNVSQLLETDINAGMNIEIPTKKYKIKSPHDYYNFVIHSTTRKNTTITYYVFKYIDGEFKKSYRVYDIIKEKKVFRNEVNNLNLSPEYWNTHFFLDKEVLRKVK
ncbi:hypothetical protein [Flavobacterium branchiicola]|nr:hypothetical protein [Flavobacterium branchiicola]